MTLFNYAHDSGVFVNRCPSCSGTWLESGQLELICRYRIGTPAVQSLANALAAEMRTANRWRRVRDIIRSRLLSGMVAIAYLIVAMLVTGNAETVFRLVIFLLLPLACIWFCDGMGNLKGISFGLARPMITRTTPGDFVAIAGWLLLLSPVVTALIARM